MLERDDPSTSWSWGAGITPAATPRNPGMTSQFTTHLDAAGIHRCILPGANKMTQVAILKQFASMFGRRAFFSGIAA
jgi:hypothetical protein